MVICLANLQCWLYGCTFFFQLITYLCSCPLHLNFYFDTDGFEKVVN